MAGARPFFAIWMGWSLWAQSGIHVQAPRANPKPEANPRAMPAARVGRDIRTIKQGCRLRLLANADDLFLDGQAVFADGAQRVLSQLGPMLRKQEEHPIEVEGHSDGSGDAGKRRRLSEDRARAVEAWLTAHEFLTPRTAEVRGYGETKPILAEVKADGSVDAEARRVNRRVEIVIDRCKR
jgi:outer membrane protein OmpA-like peptidoglycan-associated protein